MKQRWLLALISLGFVWFVFTRYAELKNILIVLSSGHWQWVAVALFFQFLFYLAYIWIYKESFIIIGVNYKYREIAPVVLGSFFLNILAPAAGVAGIAFFAEDVKNKGYSTSKAATSIILAWMVEYGVFIAILLFSVFYLSLANLLNRYELISASILLAIVFAVAGLLSLGLRKPKLLERFLGGFESNIEKVLSVLNLKSPFERGWGRSHAEEFNVAARSISRKPDRIARALAVSLLMHLAGILVFLSIFIAFTGSENFGLAVLAYSMVILFWVISPTPQGIGVVEAVVPLVLVSLGVSGSVAVVVTLAFRGLSLWLPLFVGFVLIYRAGFLQRKPRV